jgi:hypothetical protein
MAPPLREKGREMQVTSHLRRMERITQPGDCLQAGTYLREADMARCIEEM